MAAGAFPRRVLVRYDLLHPLYGQGFSLTSFMISTNFPGLQGQSPNQQHLSEASLKEAEASQQLPQFLWSQYLIRFSSSVWCGQMVSVWSDRSPWSPCSLPLLLVFIISLCFWEGSCKEQDAYLPGSFVGISAATCPGGLHARGDVGPVCLPPSKPKDALQEPVLSIWCSRPPPTSMNCGSGFSVCLSIFILKRQLWGQTKCGHGAWLRYLQRYYLLVADFLPAPYCSPCDSRTHLLLTPTQVFKVPIVEIGSPDQRLQACPGLPLTQPKPTHCLLSNFFQVSTFNFPRWSLLTWYKMRCGLIVDGSHRGTSSLPTLCRWRKCPI